MEIKSTEQFRAALQSLRLRKIVNEKETARFLHQAAKEDDLEVKKLLREIASRQAESEQDKADVESALTWLALYRDPELVAFYMTYLDDHRYSYHATLGLIELARSGILTSEDYWVSERIIRLMMTCDPLEWEMMAVLLKAMQAVNALEFLLAQWRLHHPDMRVRRVIATGLITLIKFSGRTDLFDLMASMLEDESGLVRHEAASYLFMYFPERFPDIDLKKLVTMDKPAKAD